MFSNNELYRNNTQKTLFWKQSPNLDSFECCILLFPPWDRSILVWEFRKYACAVECQQHHQNDTALSMCSNLPIDWIRQLKYKFQLCWKVYQHAYTYSHCRIVRFISCFLCGVFHTSSATKELLKGRSIEKDKIIKAIDIRKEVDISTGFGRVEITLHWANLYTVVTINSLNSSICSWSN